MTFSILLDCSSSHCFIDLSWAVKHGLLLNLMILKKLVLIDDTSNAVVIQETSLLLHFASGETTPFTFYITLLGASCPMVSGLNWLTCYNLLVDWALRSITFHTLSQESTPNPTSPQASSLQEALPSLTPVTLAVSLTPLVPPISLTSPSSHPPSISLVNTVAFTHASKLPGSQVFQISLMDLEVSACTTVMPLP